MYKKDFILSFFFMTIDVRSMTEEFVIREEAFAFDIPVGFGIYLPKSEYLAALEEKAPEIVTPTIRDHIAVLSDAGAYAYILAAYTIHKQLPIMQAKVPEYFTAERIVAIKNVDPVE